MLPSLFARSLAVHPTQSLLLSSSDDMTIRLWDWEKGCSNMTTFEGHSHYVMMISFNPKVLLLVHAAPSPHADARFSAVLSVDRMLILLPAHPLTGRSKCGA